jgi:EAL and modified HD-GYP domain-containing signal transduction protein
MLDSFLDKPMDQVLADLPLAADIRAALLEHSGALGTALDSAIAFEGRDDACALPSGVRADEWNKCYIDALSWTREMGKLLDY